MQVEVMSAPRAHLEASLHHTRYRIAFSLPVFRPPVTSDTSIMLQYMMMDKLKARGHALTCIAPVDWQDVICSADLASPLLAVRTWSRSLGFNLARKAAWRVQRALGVPYLNVFSNLSLYDAALQCLPGHDLVQERNGLYKMGVAKACRRLRLPYILFFDADDILEHELFGKPLKGLLRWRAVQAIRYNLNTAVRVLCVSTLARDHLVNAWQVPAERIVVLPNAVDVERFRPYPASRGQLRSRFGVGEEPLILFVGSFFPYQDVELLLRSFRIVLEGYPRARLILVGEGEQHAQMVQYAHSLGLGNSVQFTGFLPHDEIPMLISAADVAIAPYKKIDERRFLGSSMKLVEYMACGAAVVATKIGQLQEVIRMDENGILVPPGEAEALAHAIQRLLHDPSLRSRLGEQARKDAIQAYSWEAYITRLEGVYAAVILDRKAKRRERYA